jgi:CheY-like chemotaxis protein
VTRLPKRILVIDDDSDDVELIDRALMDQGYVALLATNVDDAIRIALMQQPALVLLDIRMPRMNGFEVAALIREQPGLELTRIVAVTGSSADRDALITAGFDGYIQKPIDHDAFVDQLKSFLP